MKAKQIEELKKQEVAFRDLLEEKEFFWANPKKRPFEEVQEALPVNKGQVEEARKRLERFAPFIERVFPESKENRGIIESPLVEIPSMKKRLLGEDFPGKLWIKLDSHLPIAGSIKARGGIYEVLAHTEELALKHGLLDQKDYASLGGQEAKAFFKDYTIQVGSTGNLGLSIGISSAQIGYKVIVHMSQDAKEWKKDLLREYGVEVKEYSSDYSLAVKEGRSQSDQDPMSYFVDDENSVDLFMGYAVAGKRLADQLEEEGIVVNRDQPLCIYIPCGVGGAPGGVTYGLKTLFGDNVHVFFIEPTKAPAMVLGMMTGLHDKVSVEDVGIDGKTEADGLAVGRPSGFVGHIMDPLLDGLLTIEDKRLFPLIQSLYEEEKIFIEPSAAASFQGPILLSKDPKMQAYFAKEKIHQRATHIVWATGGNLVPSPIREEYLGKSE